MEGDPHPPGPSQGCACLCGSFCHHTSWVPRMWVTQNTQPGRAVPAPPVRTRGQGGAQAHGEVAGWVWGLSWLRGSGSMCLSAAQAKGPGLRDPQLLWALEPQDRPGGTGPGPKGWMQGPWDFPPGGTAGSLGAHPVVPTAADLQLFRAAVSANKPHSTAEHFINEQTLHLRGLRSRGSEAASSLTSSHSTSQGA